MRCAMSWMPPGLIDVERNVASAGTQIGDDRRPFRNAFEIFEREFHAGLARHR